MAKLVSPYPVNIFLTEKAIPYTEIWDLSQELRYLLKQTLVVGHSRVVTPSRLAEINLLPPIWDSNTYRKINTIIKSGNPMLIKKELFYLFDRWGELGYPQVLLENALFKLAHLLQLACLNNSAAELLLYKNAINEKLAMAPDFKNVYDDIWEVLISLYSFDQDKYDNSKERVDCVASYLKDNFAKPQSMEEISHRFNFNPSYLTRIFKKHKGNSPVQYLINLRIEEAKRLIRRNPDMDFKEIGEIVGYNDNYYFYRAFKTVSGLTLSDFKEEVLK